MMTTHIWSSAHKPGIYLDLNSFLLEKRIIFIGPEVNSESASSISMELLVLAEEESPISMYLNCYGGSVPAGLAIIDMMNYIKHTTPVYTYCIGECVGIATAILAMGTKGKRRAFPSARISIFQEWYGIETLWGTRAQTDDERTRLLAVIEHLFREHTHLHLLVEQELTNHLQELHFFDVSKAREFNIIDDVCGAASEVILMNKGDER